MLADASIDSLHNWAPTKAEDDAEHEQGHDMGSDHTSRILWPSDRSPSRSFTLASIAASSAYSAAIHCQILSKYIKGSNFITCTVSQCQVLHKPAFNDWQEWCCNDVPSLRYSLLLQLPSVMILFPVCAY